MNPDSRIFLRPIGSPVGLGLAGLAVASLVLSGHSLGWISGSESVYVGVVLLAFPFPLQATASLLSFIARDGAVGTALGILAATWLSESLIRLVGTPTGTSGALGLLLLTAGPLLAGCALAAGSTKVLPGLVFGLEAVRFVFAGIYELGHVEGWQNASGVVGLAVTALAGYAVLAAVLEDARSRTVLPIGRRGPGPAVGEPGVRPQL